MTDWLIIQCMAAARGSEEVAMTLRRRRAFEGGWLAVVSTLGAHQGGCHCVYLYLMMFPSGSSIRLGKGANGEEL